MIHPYKMNNYRLFKKNIENLDKNLDILPMLVILYLGNDLVINVMFKNIVELLGESGGMNRNTLGIDDIQT